MEDIKLTVNAVLGEGNKLIFDVPEFMQGTLLSDSIQPGDVLTVDQLELWYDIARACHEHHAKNVDTVDLKVPRNLMDQTKKNGERTIRIVDLFPNSQNVSDERISEEERVNIIDAIFNKDRAIDERSRRG